MHDSADDMGAAVLGKALFLVLRTVAAILLAFYALYVALVTYLTRRKEKKRDAG